MTTPCNDSRILSTSDWVSRCGSTPFQNRFRLLDPSLHDQPTGTLGNAKDQDEQKHRRHHLREEHQPPPRMGQPRLITAQGDRIIDKIDHQHTEDDGKLIPRHQSAPLFGRSHLGDIHRRQHRGQTDPDSSDDPIYDKTNNEFMRLSGRETHLRIGRSNRRQNEQHRSDHQAPFTSQTGRHESTDHSADDTSDQGARHGKPQQRAGCCLIQPQRIDKIDLEILHRTRNNRRIVSEQQTAQCSDQRQKHQVAITIFFI